MWIVVIKADCSDVGRQLKFFCAGAQGVISLLLQSNIGRKKDSTDLLTINIKRRAAAKRVELRAILAKDLPDEILSGLAIHHRTIDLALILWHWFATCVMMMYRFQNRATQQFFIAIAKHFLRFCVLENSTILAVDNKNGFRCLLKEAIASLRVFE